MNFHSTAMPRSFTTSSTQRLVTHANGQIGSKKNSRSGFDAMTTRYGHFPSFCTLRTPRTHLLTNVLIPHSTRHARHRAFEKRSPDPISTMRAVHKRAPLIVKRHSQKADSITVTSRPTTHATSNRTVTECTSCVSIQRMPNFRKRSCFTTVTAAAGDPYALVDRVLTSQNTNVRLRVRTRSISPSRQRQLRSRTM